jgi:hypothetical protein
MITPANGRVPLELVEGTVEQTNGNGIRVDGTWYSRSQFRPVELPSIGARVCLRVDAKRFISSVDVLEQGQSPAARLSRDETISRLAVLKAAASFLGQLSQTREDVRSEHVLVLADRWLDWVAKAD